VGGFLLEHYRWSSLFYSLGPASLAVVALVALYVPRPQNLAPHPLDFLGLILSGGFMGLLIYTIIEAPGHGWVSAASLGGFAGAALLLIAFIIEERHTAEPMLDVRLFKDMRFSAASAAVTVAFFTLSGFIFLMTQFFQFVRTYSPLSTGVHLLPVAACVAIGSTLGTRLAVRLGTKAIVTAGLVMQAGFYFWVASDISPTLSYGVIAVQMVVYGLGMGLTSAPATESIMGAVATEKAGVGSAVNDSTRLLGGTLGVAVIGSVYASLYNTRLKTSLPAALPHSFIHLVHQSIGAAFGVSRQLNAHGQFAAGAAVRQAAASAFDHGLSVGCVVAGAVAVAGALLAATFLPAQPRQQPGPQHHPADAAKITNDRKDLVR
jgi:predicted MFS family arabinose efflux permease